MPPQESTHDQHHPAPSGDDRRRRRRLSRVAGLPCARRHDRRPPTAPVPTIVHVCPTPRAFGLGPEGSIEWAQAEDELDQAVTAEATTRLADFPGPGPSSSDQAASAASCWLWPMRSTPT